MSACAARVDAPCMFAPGNQDDIDYDDNDDDDDDNDDDDDDDDDEKT